MEIELESYVTLRVTFTLLNILIELFFQNLFHFNICPKLLLMIHHYFQLLMKMMSLHHSHFKVSEISIKYVHTHSSSKYFFSSVEVFKFV